MIRGLLRSKKAAWPIVLAASAILIPALGCSSGSGGIANITPVVRVETATARQQAIENVVTAQGLVYPIHQASITPKITAPVDRYYVNRGSHVHAGQLLAKLANQDLAANLVSARGAYDQALANYESTTSSTLPEEIQTAETTLENAKSKLHAQRRLYKSELNLYKQGAIARNLLDSTGVALTNAKTAYQRAVTRLHNLNVSGKTAQQRAAKGQLEAAHGRYLNAKAQLAYTEIRSPINGVIADRAVYPGNVAPAGTPLLVVMNTSSIIVRLHIPQTQAELLKLGNPATIKVPGTKKVLSGKVTVISPALDPNSTTVEVWVQARNPHDVLQPGTSVSVSIVAGKIPNAVVVPDPAILTNAAGQSHVMVVRSNVAYAQPVTTGIEQNGLIQILSGLKPGEQVIVSGGYGLPDKTKVNATPADQSGSSQPGDSSQS